ncbi:hypothetical protein BJY52DRAFT_1232170 [Lactarius psammicola]|nr:hypothetical protein BJY52DRAFT_1232170 [Lactarius psammicola]
MEQNNPNPPSTPLGQHIPWSTPTIPQPPIEMGDLNQHLAASLNDGIEVFDAIQSTPTTWDPTPPVSSVQMERQGTPIGLYPITDDTINQQGVIVDGEDSRMASPIQYNDDNENMRDSSEPPPRSHSASCRDGKGPFFKRLPEKTRRLIEETFRTNAGFDQGVTLPEEPETINIRSSSTPRASRARSKGRDHSRSSAWTHLTYESGCSEELAYFQEAVPVPTNIAEFFSDIEKAIKHPMLTPPIDLSDMEVEGNKGDEVYGVGYSTGQKEDLAMMIQDLREEIGRDVLESASGWSEFYLQDMIKLRVGSSIPANIQDFNDSMGMVLSALDAGLDDNLTTKGVMPSSWFRLSAALLAAMTCGVLRSGGPKVKGRVKLTPDEDHFRVAPGLGMPATEGGRIIVMARHLAELFEQHEKGDNLPFIEYFNNLQKVTQKHIQRAVKLAAVEAYQESTGDAEKIREIVMDDMADQLINQLKDDPVVQAEVERKVRERMMKKLEDECIEDIDEWRTVYRKGLTAALRAEAMGTDIPVLSHSQIVWECSEEIQAQADKKAAEIKESIIKEEVEKYILLQEMDNARAIIRRKYLENIEEAQREVRAEITSEKKNWAVAYCNSVQLTFLREKAALLGYQLFQKDEDEECEGCMAKCAIPDGKRSRSTSCAKGVTPDTIPVTPTVNLQKLDGSVTPQAKKNKKKKSGGRKLIILKPFSVASSEASSAEDGMEEDPIPPSLLSSMEPNNPNPPPTPSGQHVPWSTPTIPQPPIDMGDLNQHLTASINDGIEVYDAIQSTPTVWEPTPPVSSGQMELQGTPTGLEPILNDTINQQSVDGEDSRMASPVQFNEEDNNERDSSEPLCLGVKLGPSSQSSLRATIVRAVEMERGRSLKRLPEKTRRLIEETFRTNSGFDQGVTLPEEPETINVRSSSTPRASRARSKGRDHSRSSAWTHLTYESGCSEELAYFREAVPVPTNIAEFFGDIEKAIKYPMLAQPIDLSDMEVEGDKGEDIYGVGYSAGQKEDLAAMIQDLREEIGRDVSEGASGWLEFYLRDMIKLHAGSSIPANVQDFNNSMGMDLSVLDAGLDDDLPTKGVTPSSWFRLSAALLAAMTRGVLRSGGPKVKGRHEKGDNLPFVEYFNNLQKVTQKHIQRAVKLAAVEAYQESTGNAEKIHEIVMDDMADQLINQLKDDPEAQAEVERKVRERMMKKLEKECIEDIDEWRTVYRKGLAAALQAEATGTDIPRRNSSTSG